MEGYSSTMINGTRFTVPSRYQVVRALGHGAYGVVCLAKDTITGENVAIKKIARLFDHVIDTKRALRELRILSHFSHQNIIELKDIIIIGNEEDFEDLYVITDLMDTDMHQIISSSQSLSEEHISYFMYQLLHALHYTHSAHIIHRDLKPSNILLNSNCDLKLCDFGLARHRDEENDEQGKYILTEYVATRWYRAPEIICGWKHYHGCVDVWSVGCIFAELLQRRPLFAGKDYLKQLHLIMDVTGTPDDAQIKGIASSRARAYLKSLPPKRGIPIKHLLPKASPEAVDLLNRMLTFNPMDRITVEEALKHPFITSVHIKGAGATYTGPEIEFEFDDGNIELTKPLLRQYIFREYVKFQQSMKKGATGMSHTL
ncbi:Mitogen activated protein kinase 13 [Carpediemonas membranifera]|uniref:Mitogen-activated protein kinase n=1 Tax=Carpediemonas membranifera TaxID=201153 RepID=A0A8J6E9C7_9EUKA|nr:Mitogen activated protein kinase 13 [Carpediemonas membranifera]|eukprot:KAG9393145.1 Mitogen activated protein kinase 13 [Carpediemonas membranifera]